MWLKHRAWIPVSWALAAINIGAVWFAARPGEAWHAIGHALLAVAFALGARHLMARRQTALPAPGLQQALDQDQFQQESIDEMQSRLQELEERLDFSERLLAKQRDAEPANARDKSPP
jgi:hypothetical protein